MSALTVRYASKLVGVLSCFDRLLITGTLPIWCYPEGMARYLTERNIRLFDYVKQFAQPLCDALRAHAEQVAADAGLTIEFIRNSTAFRKEDRIQAILRQRGTHPGLVHIFSALERGTGYTPHYHRPTGQTTLRCKQPPMLHYSFYFIDPAFGLCYLRVPTWPPFTLPCSCNGHAWLAHRLQAEGIAFTPLDNTFLRIADLPRAQALADAFSGRDLHRLLDAAAQRCCPALRQAPERPHWSLTQVEYATDLIFRRREDLQPLYQRLVRTAIHTVRPEHIATFFGKALPRLTAAELGADFATRAYGTRLKHYLDGAALKLYDKHGRVLRIETTVNKVSQFTHYRSVEHRNGTTGHAQAPLRKTIYSLPALAELLRAANHRYLAFLSDLDDPSDGQRHLSRLGPSRTQEGRSFRGSNLFLHTDLEALLALLRGEMCLHGITNRRLRHLLPAKSSAQISYSLKRCRVFGLLKKCSHRHRYYLTQLGRRVLLAARHLQEFLLVPALAGQQPV